ncbi:Helix-turn-helix domain-containing protein [Lachnospiraceae bacterium C7]|nr:Helix-turn-helix domain-containing protein [Lachnospiraceae bacterium C7]
MFRVNYCGYNVHNPDGDIIYRPNGTGDYLFVVISSPMYFYIKNETIDALPGSCILYTPGEKQHYAANQEFFNSFVHFSCDKEDILPYKIPTNTLFFPKSTDNILHLIKNIRNEQLNQFTYKEKMQNNLLEILLMETSRNIIDSSNEYLASEMYDNFNSARMQMLFHPGEDWDISKLCALTHIGKSQFHVYYKKFFHTTPKEDLILARIDQAKYLLSNQNLQISDVAEQSGFKNINHFNRYFKKICGCTPSEYKIKHT